MIELLQASIANIQKQYEMLSVIVTEHGGKVHGSQSHIIANNDIQLIVYYEVPQGQRAEVSKSSITFFLRVLVEQTTKNNNTI